MPWSWLKRLGLGLETRSLGLGLDKKSYLHHCIYVKKTVQFIETLCKGDIVIRDIKQQRSIFYDYKISNFTVKRPVIHSQKNPTDVKA